MALAKSVYAVPTWTRLVALVSEHATLHAVALRYPTGPPSISACYRLTIKLRVCSDILDGSIGGVTGRGNAERHR
jgi:hypothetical protein